MANLYYLCIVEKMHVIDLNRTDTTYRNESLETWIRTIRDYKVLSASEEEEIIPKAQSGDKEALNTIIKGNQRFLLAAARTYSRYADEILDLISEGNLALLHAVRNFNPSYNVKFISFAAWYIRRYMSDYFVTNSLVKHRITPTVNAYAKDAKEQYRKENEFDMPDWMLSELMKDEFDRDFKQGGSYFKPVDVYYDDELIPSDYDGDSTIDILTAVENEAVNTFYNEDLETIARNLVDNVCQNQMERDVIIYGYGLFENQQLSDFEIGLKHNLSEVQVAYVRRKVINHMILYANGKRIRLNKSKFQEQEAEQGKTRGRNTRDSVHKSGTHNPRKNVRKRR